MTKKGSASNLSNKLFGLSSENSVIKIILGLKLYFVLVEKNGIFRGGINASIETCWIIRTKGGMKYMKNLYCLGPA